jgi:DivIVA domain-containing protein
MIISSDEIRSTSFGIERKGYNKTEVDSLLERVSRTISQLEETERILRQQLRAGEATGESDAAASPSPAATAEPEDFAAIGAEVTAVLQTARESADSMRSAAESQADEIRRKADEFASECRRKAETDAEELRGAAAIAASTLKSEAQHDRSEAETVLKDATDKAASLRAEAEQKATHVVEAAEQQAADLVATATETAESEYRVALASTQQRLADAQGTEQEILYSLTAVHSDVGAAIARLDQEARSGETEAPAPGPAPLAEQPAEAGKTADAAEGDEPSDDAPGLAATSDAAANQSEPETDLERTTRQVTGGLAESLRETAGVSGPVGALFGLSDTDDSSAPTADEDASAATPTEPETIDLRERPEAVQSLADSDDPLADLVKQAVGKAVERAAEETPEGE